MDASCTTVINSSFDDLKSWLPYSEASTYPNYDHFNYFNNSGEICTENTTRIIPTNNEINFRLNSGDFAVSSSTVDIKAENTVSKIIDRKNLVLSMNNSTGSSTGGTSEDTWSSRASISPETLINSSSEDMNSDDSYIAQKSAPILRQTLTKSAVEMSMASSYWQGYQQSHQPLQQIPPSYLSPDQYQQCCHFQGQFQPNGQLQSHGNFQPISQPLSQCSQFSEGYQVSQFRQNHFQQTSQNSKYCQFPQYNRLEQQNLQKPSQYAANTNYFGPTQPCYQPIREQEVESQMVGIVSQMTSGLRSLPPGTELQMGGIVSSIVPESGSSPSSVRLQMGVMMSGMASTLRSSHPTAELQKCEKRSQMASVPRCQPPSAGLQMGGVTSPTASTCRYSPPGTMSVSSTTQFQATSSPSQISSSEGFVSALPSQKKPLTRPRNKPFPSHKDSNGTVYHKCPVCFRSFKNKSNIKTHLRTHTKEKPYVCEVCKKAFCQKAHLHKHLAIHERAKN